MKNTFLITAAALACLCAAPARADQWFGEEKHADWVSGIVMNDEYVAQSVRIFTRSEDSSVFMIDFRDGAAHTFMLENSEKGRRELPLGKFEGSMAVGDSAPRGLSFTREASGGGALTRFSGIEYKNFIEALLSGKEVLFAIGTEGRPCKRHFSLEGFKSAYEKAFILNRKISKNPAYGNARTGAQAAALQPETPDSPPASSKRMKGGN